jgi:hypothetical protein
MKAKFIYESISDLLKPKSKEEVFSNMPIHEDVKDFLKRIGAVFAYSVNVGDKFICPIVYHFKLPTTGEYFSVNCQTTLKHLSNIGLHESMSDILRPKPIEDVIYELDLPENVKKFLVGAGAIFTNKSNYSTEIVYEFVLPAGNAGNMPVSHSFIISNHTTLRDLIKAFNLYKIPLPTNESVFQPKPTEDVRSQIKNMRLADYAKFRREHPEFKVSFDLEPFLIQIHSLAKRDRYPVSSLQLDGESARFIFKDSEIEIIFYPSHDEPDTLKVLLHDYNKLSLSGRPTMYHSKKEIKSYEDFKAIAEEFGFNKPILSWPATQ